MTIDILVFAVVIVASPYLMLAVTTAVISFNWKRAARKMGLDYPGSFNPFHKPVLSGDYREHYVQVSMDSILTAGMGGSHLSRATSRYERRQVPWPKYYTNIDVELSNHWYFEFQIAVDGANVYDTADDDAADEQRRRLLDDRRLHQALASLQEQAQGVYIEYGVLSVTRRRRPLRRTTLQALIDDVVDAATRLDETALDVIDEPLPSDDDVGRQAPIDGSVLV